MPGSYSSSVGSGVSSTSKAEPGSNRGLSGDDGDETGFMGNAFEAGLMGMLYTVGKEKKYTLPFVIFRLLIDLVQLLLLSMNPQYGFNIDPSNGAWKVFSFLQLNAFLSARGYNFFLGCMYIMAAGLVLNVGLCIWVSKAFAENRFDHVWPIVWLRWYSLVFYQVLDIASMSLFLMTMDCQYYWVDPAVQFTHQEFGVACFTMPHVVHIVVATAALIIFGMLATPFTMAEIDLNPVSKNALGMGHTKVEGISFVLKFVMTSATVFINSPQWLSIILTFLSAYLLYLYLKWEPHANSIVNQVRVASYSMVLYSSLMLVAVAYPPSSVNKDDPDQLSSYQAQVTGALWGGLVPAGLLGWLGSWLRLRYFLKTVTARFESAPLEMRTTHIYKFSDPREVEIASRVLRVWVDEDTLDPGRVALAERIMRAGKSQLGSSPYMDILWSSFLIDVQGSYQSGYLALQAAKKAPHPTFLERFAIFIREQEHTQKATAATAGDSGNVDLVSYVEFQRNLSLVIRLHTEALLAKRAFWTALESHRLARFDKLAAAVNRIEGSVKSAERMYRTVLTRHSSSVKILQLYVKFLQIVKGDPWSAARWAAEAEKLQRSEEEANEKAVMGGRQNTMENSDESKGVIIIGANCLIRMANDTAAAVLGYEAKARMIGHNVNIVVPPPFAKMHNQYVRNYITTGSAKILNQTNEFVAVHRDRYVVPVRLQVTHVSGIGEDSVFMGVFQPLPQKENVATLWVLSTGAIVACDATFTDWLGFKQGDLHMRSFGDLVLERDELERVLAGARDAQNGNSSHYSDHISAGAGLSTAVSEVGAGGPIAEGVEEEQEEGLYGQQHHTAAGTAGVKGDSPRGIGRLRAPDEILSFSAQVSQGAQQHQASPVHKISAGSGAFPTGVLVPSAQHNMSTTIPSYPDSILSLLGPEVSRPNSAARAAPAPGLHSSTNGFHTTSVTGNRASGTSNTQTHHTADEEPAVKRGHPSHTSSSVAASGGGIGKQNVRSSVPGIKGQSLLGAGVSGVRTRQRVTDEQDWMRKYHSQGKGAAEAVHILEGVRMRHNFKERTVKVDMEVRACSMGDRSFFVVSLTRSEAEESLTLVTDNKGHVVHATQALAARLGTSVSALYSGGAAHALDALLPAPFTRVHHLWYKDAAQIMPTVAGTAQAAPPPPHSCRSGLPVCLPATSFMGLPEQQVYSLSFKLRTVSPLDAIAARHKASGHHPHAAPPPPSHGPQAAQRNSMNDALHVVTLTPSTMEAALDARRLRLVVSMEDATVLSTSPSPDALFGFGPQSLVGTSLAFAIDVLRPRPRPGTEMGKSQMAEAEKAAGRLLRMLAERNRSAPGASWRVGVSPSIDPVEVAALGGVGEDMVAAATKAAVMTVRFKVEAPTLAGSTLILPKVVELEVELWRSDLMTAVLEVDNHGNVVATGMPGIPFYEPHLVLGVPRSKVSSTHLSSLLPVRSGLPAIAALFTEGGLVSLGSGNGGPATGRKGGGLKSKASKGAVGPLHTVRLAHMGDGKELELRVMAVVKGAPGMSTSSAYVLARFGTPPACGRPDLAAYLEYTSSVPRPPAMAMPTAVAARQQRGSQLMSREPSRALVSPTPVAPINETQATIDVDAAEALLFGHTSPPAITRRPSVQFVKEDTALQPDGGSLLALDVAEQLPSPSGPKPGRHDAVAAWLATHSHDAQMHVAAPPGIDDLPDGHLTHTPSLNGEDEEPADAEEEVASVHNVMDSDGFGHDGLEADMVDHEADASTMAAYKRGKRYKRLCKMLTGKEMQGCVKRLKYAVYAVTALLLAIEVASFTSYYVQLLAQNTQIDYMFGTARAANEALAIVQQTAGMKALCSNQGGNGLRYLTNNTYNSSNFIRYQTLMKTSIDQVMLHHQGLYHGYDNLTIDGTRMPDAYGLRALWETPSLNFSQWYADKLNVAYQPIAEYGLLSLWEGGNLYLAAARNILANGMLLNKTGPTPFANMTDTWFILENGANALNQGYRKSAVGILAITLDKSDALNKSQQIMLIIKGTFAMVAAIGITAYFSQALARRRHSVYTVFVRVPIGVIHGLASAPLGLGEDEKDDDEDDRGEAGQQQDGDGQRGEPDLEALTGSGGKRKTTTIDGGQASAIAGKDVSVHGNGANGGSVHGGNAMGAQGGPFPPHRLSAVSTSDPKNGGAKGGLFGALASWLSPGGGNNNTIAPLDNTSGRGNKGALGWGAGKGNNNAAVTGAAARASIYGGRGLLKSYRDTILLVWPFVLWGAVVVALNSQGVLTLADMGGAIANLNIVAGVFQSVNRCNVASIKLVQAYPNITLQRQLRAQLQLDLDYLKTIYQVELYGNAEVNASLTDDLTGGHATQGVAFQGEGFQILYGNNWGNNGCMAFNAADCLNSSALFYPYTSNGLDALLEKYIYSVQDLLRTPLENVSFASPPFKYIFEEGFIDVVNGRRRQSLSYVTFVHSLYNSTLVLHAVSLGFSAALVALYLLFIFRPFVKKANNEPRRVAELLSCLPPELDVEGMVKGAVLTKEEQETMRGDVSRSANSNSSRVFHSSSNWD